MTYAPVPHGSVTTPAGFSAGAAAADVKGTGTTRDDVCLIVSDRPCTAAAIFTRNLVQAAPVTVSRATVRANSDAIRAVAANAGNANACTGEQGLADARAMAGAAADALGCDPAAILVMSTGVIGVPLPLARVADGIARAAAACSADGGRTAARAIMTTDTVPKAHAVRVTLSTGAVTIGGIAKGSGMIHPDMATMLAIVTTDAALPADALDAALRTAADASFNRISVDGDTSTNDSVYLLANGAAGVSPADDDDLDRFTAGLTAVCRALAQAIVRDGEGASRFITLRVTGAADSAAAHRVANTIATSPLVKTAFAGGDANWGRILAAAGRAGVPFDPDRCSLRISADDAAWLTLVANGMPLAYAEADAAAIFAQTDVWVEVGLGAGTAAETVWTCDMTHDYISINADYRT